METKAGIRDDQITASSHYQNQEPWNGRLNNYVHWATKCHNALDPWIQVNLIQQFVITGVIIQGSGQVTTTQAWVTHLKVEYGESETMLEYVSQNGSHKVRFVFVLFFVLFCLFVCFCFCFVFVFVCICLFVYICKKYFLGFVYTPRYKVKQLTSPANLSLTVFSMFKLKLDCYTL